MKRKHHLAFRLRDLVERECSNVPASMALHLLNEIEKHEREEEETEKRKKEKQHER